MQTFCSVTNDNLDGIKDFNIKIVIIMKRKNCLERYSKVKAIL